MLITNPYSNTLGFGEDEVDDISLLSRLGHAGVSGLGVVGNLLDLPGSMIRDTLGLGAYALTGGQAGVLANPLNQLLHPFSHRERGISVEGRDLNTALGLSAPNKATGIKGWFDDPAEGVRDVGGLATEIALDPLTYLTLGATRALGTGGEVVRAAGAAKMGALDRMTKTVGQVAKDLPADLVDDAAKAAGFKNRAEFLFVHGGDPMGGIAKLHVPFTDMQMLVGKTAKKPVSEVRGAALPFERHLPKAATETVGERISRSVGEGMKTTGEMLRFGKVPFTEFSPGQQFARIFDSFARDLQTPEVHPHAAAVTKAIDDKRDFVLSSVGRDALAVDREVGLGPVSSKIARQHLEGQLHLHELSPAELDVANKVIPHVSHYRTLTDDALDDLMREGGRISDLNDKAWVDYVTRTMVDMDEYKAGFGREEHLKDIFGGTERVREIFNDPELLKGNANQAYAMLVKKYGKDFVQRVGDQELLQTFIQRLRETFTPGQRAVGGYGNDVFADLKDGLVGIYAKTAKVREGNQAIAKFARSTLRLKGEKGVPVGDLLDEMGVNAGMERVEHAAVGMPGELYPGRAGAPRPELPANIPLGSALDEAGNPILPKIDPRNRGALMRIDEAMRARGMIIPTVKIKVARGASEAERQAAKQARKVAKAERLYKISMMQVPERFAADIIRLQKTDANMLAGPLTQMTDMLQTAFKVGVLSMPARPVRDFMSGQIHAMITGNWTRRGFKESYDLMRGKAVDFRDIPEVARMMKEQGLPDTVEASTEAYQQIVYAREMYGGGSLSRGEMLSPGAYGTLQRQSGAVSAGSIAGASQSYLPTRSADFRAGFVGKDPIDFLKPSTLKAGTTWNPLDIAGLPVRHATEKKLTERLATGNKWVATHERFSRGTDFLNRNQVMLTQMRKGASSKRAAEIANANQVNYSPHTFTTIERQKLKRLFPFYSFSSRMVKHLFQELGSAPGGGLAQAIRTQHGATTTELPLPAYVGQAGAIPISEGDDGTKRYLTSLGLMHEDPLSLLGGGAGGVGLELLSRATPLAKAPVELATGESFFQRGQLGGGRELGEADPPLGRLLTNLGLKEEVAGRATPAIPEALYGTSIEHLLANSPVSRLISTARTLTDPRKRLGDTPLPGVSLLPALTGLRLTDVSPQAQDVAISQRADQLAKEKLGGRSFQTTYIPRPIIDQAKLKNPTLAAQMEDFNKLHAMLRKRDRARQKAQDAQKLLQQATAP